MKQLVITVISGFLLLACQNVQQPPTEKPDTDSTISDSLPTAKDTMPQVDTLSIIGVGDIMLGSDIPARRRMPPHDDCQPLMSEVAPILRDADITFGNLEGAFSDTATIKKGCDDPATCYAFRTPRRFFKCIIDAGFDLYSLSNNHAGDLGQIGRQETMELVEASGGAHAGLLQHPIGILEKDGITYALCAFSPIDGTCRIENQYIPDAVKIVEKAVNQADIVIVSFHGGAEGNAFTHVPRKVEYAYGENRGDVYRFAHAMVDAGADVIFGHGPHVPRALELYNNRLIVYSLGNFCTTGFGTSGALGMAPIVKVFINPEGEFLKGQITAAHQTSPFAGVKLDPNKRVIGLMQKLTAADFPETPLIITDEGKVMKKEE